MDSKKAQACPPKPKAVLRIGFAGTRKLDDKKLKKALKEIFPIIGNRLIELNQAPRQDEGHESNIHEFYSTEPPLLRLVTGLAEGADDAAAQSLNETTPEFGGCLETSLAGILPFDLPTYRQSRDECFRNRFDDQAAQCEYIVTLDGIYDHSKNKLATIRRKKAYSAQSQVLLRHCDILIAATEVDADSKAGGTVESINRALNLGRTVIFIDTNTGSIYLIKPGENFWTVLNNPPHTKVAKSSKGSCLKEALDQLVEKILVDPDIQLEKTNELVSDSEGLNFLNVYFHGSDLPKGKTKTERVWEGFNWFFKYGAKPGSDKTLGDYNVYRSRSSKLNYFYAGLYRGTFFINYVLAMLAVSFAVLSISLFGSSANTHTNIGASLGNTIETVALENGTSTKGPTQKPIHSLPFDAEAKTDGSTNKLADGEDSEKETAPEPETIVASQPAPPKSEPEVEGSEHQPATEADAVPAPELKEGVHHGSSNHLTLLLLAFAKILAVGWISYSTHQANKHKWNDLAVDFRYLSERLRPLNYLPLASSFHPPDVSPPQYASRAVRQSAAEWLFGAITRSVSPKNLANPTTYQRHDQTGEYEVCIQNFCPTGILDKFNEHCIINQVQYHKTNSHTMFNLYQFTENWVRRLSISVFMIVLVDIAIVIANLPSVLANESIAPYAHWAHLAHKASPVLLFFAALFPAIVASLNGLRFQSECQRLSERSAMLRTLLGGHPAENEGPIAKRTGGNWEEINTLKYLISQAAKHPDQNIGAWCSDALQLIERISDSLTREAAEWSVLYAKELVEA